MKTAETNLENMKQGMEGLNKGVSVSDLVSLIPKFTDVEAGQIVGSFGIKDGLLIYHIYKADRKKIYDDVQARMDEVSGNGNPQLRERELSRIAREGNEALAQIPWWDDFETTLYATFQEHFKYRPLKVSFYQEVDSWSVILPEPKPPVPPTEEHLAAPIKALGARINAEG